MSIKAINWAWGVELPSSMKLVLICLADHADNDGVCWPGHAQVSEKTGVSERHVLRLIQQIAALGLLVVKTRKSEIKRQMSNVYYLNINGDILEKPGDMVSPLPHDMVSPGSTVKPGDMAGKSRVTIMSPGTTSQLEPPLEPPSTRASAREKPKILFQENKFVGIPAELAQKWREAFPLVDVEAEIAAAEVWWLSNPGRKRKANIARFLTNWLGRASKDARARPVQASAPPPPPQSTGCMFRFAEGTQCDNDGTNSPDGRRWYCRDHNPALLP